MCDPRDVSRSRDVNQLAHRLVAESLGEAERTDPPAEPDEKAAEKGRARAAALTPERRREIARGAALARWASSEAEKPS